MERALRNLDLEPAGLPAGSLLCVRRLRDPLPGRLGAAEREIELNARWSQAARDSLDRLASGAARPNAGRLPAGAEAVLFPTEADLLACFALSQAEGRMAFEWWWGCALPASDLRRTWSELWSRNPTLIPIAVQLLAAGANLPLVLRSLPGSAARPLLRQLAITYGLPELLQVLAQPAASMASSSSVARLPARSDNDTTAVARGVSNPAIFHAGFLPEITSREIAALAAVPVETALLALVGLLLVRNPARVRQAAFVPFARAVLNGAGILRRTVLPTDLGRPDIFPDAVIASATPLPVSPAQAAASGRTPFTPSPSPPTQASVPAQASPLTIPSRTAAGSSEAPAASPARLPPRLPVSERIVSTAHGGIFYLLNLALALGLYGDFTQPLRPGLALSPWKFLDLLGRRLLRGLPDAEDDSLWAALEQLAGSVEEPVAMATGLADWQPDPAWSDPPLLLPAAARSSDENFLTWLIPVLTDRLEHAGVTFPMLLGQSARLVLTAGRVDVHFSLSSHPIEIRLAGLDRDPGWIPAAGRDVRFHYD